LHCIAYLVCDTLTLPFPIACFPVYSFNLSPSVFLPLFLTLSFSFLFPRSSTLFVLVCAMSGARVIPKIFREEAGAGEENGYNARLSAYLGAIAVADLVKTTLGPKGMDKLLQPVGGAGGGPRSTVSFTNDGATILKSIPIDNPAAKIIVDTSKTQDSEVGDGTTSVAVLAGELLREAEKLVLSKIHPQTIIRGWRKAIVTARQALEASALDHGHDPAAFRQDLINIAKTTLSSKILSANKDHFAELAVDAVLRLKGSTDLSSIQLVKKVGGNLRDSYL